MKRLENVTPMPMPDREPRRLHPAEAQNLARQAREIEEHMAKLMVRKARMDGQMEAVEVLKDAVGMAGLAAVCAVMAWLLARLGGLWVWVSVSPLVGALLCGWYAVREAVVARRMWTDARPGGAMERRGR